MAVTLQVRDVRAAIYQAAGGPQSAGTGEPSTALLGRLFHEVFADLVGEDGRKNFRAALEDAEPRSCKWRAALVGHTYQQLVGPRLRQHQAVLHHVTDRVLNFWDAVQELCHWLADLLWKERERGVLIPSLGALVSVEQPLCWELREPGWADAVRLTGVADAVWRIPETDRWCVIELKTGRTSPEADLAQACLYHHLYHQMLSSSGQNSSGTLVLVSFEPQRHERLFEAEKLNHAQDRLKTLIGRLAGVLPEPHSIINLQPGRQPEPTKSAVVSPSVTPPEGQLKPAEPSAEHLELGKQLVKALREYGAEIRLDGPPIVGPTFLRFPVTLGPRVRLAAVEKPVKELQFRLKLDAPPRVGTEKGRVVIDLQRPDRQYVLFSQIRAQLPERDPLLGCSKIPLGVDIDGQLQMVDFAQPENAHLLVAGTTGSGKSEWLRSAVAGLLVTNTPDTLRLLLIDPKRNAFQMLRDSPFLRRPLVFPDEQPVVEVLEELVEEMEERYRAMSETSSDCLADHVRRTGRPLPRIFCICDEYADLLLGNRQQRRALEEQITRLGSKARAAGIHLILATQQPSREIIKGVLDATIPARVGLKTQKAIESKMLLGYAGAEALLGRGDLLFRCIGEPVRLQSAYLPVEEMAQVFSEAAIGSRSYSSQGVG